MPVTCPHCQRAFSSTRGLFGQDAEIVRDAHAAACAENPRNRCFCGRVFPSSAARENHATTCEMNPANRFKCPHCPQEFITSFGVTGLFRSDGRATRDAHAVECRDNPANMCFCGRLFPNAGARNTHAVRCELNPANCFQCQFCAAKFVTSFNMLGFCAYDGRASRDAHQVACEKNPKNVCFCGQVFANPPARERHAATCECNPANRFTCPHCERLFITRYGVMGMVASDGKLFRDSHELGCERNPANACFCGQRFLNPGLRDAHALKCHMNPVNRFNCQYCRETFVTKFGMFTTLGSVERDSHALVCRMNPANAACEHCNATFADTRGWLKAFDSDARKLCAAHKAACAMNPQNRCQCDQCGRAFVSGGGWLRRTDARAARDAHRKACDVIPCSYQVATFGDWLLVAGEAEVEVEEEPKEEDNKLAPEAANALAVEPADEVVPFKEKVAGAVPADAAVLPPCAAAADFFLDAESTDGEDSGEDEPGPEGDRSDSDGGPAGDAATNVAASTTEGPEEEPPPASPRCSECLDFLLEADEPEEPPAGGVSSAA